MTYMRREGIERQAAQEDRTRKLLALWVATGVSGLVGVVGMCNDVVMPEPKWLSLGWFAVFASWLVVELRRGK